MTHHCAAHRSLVMNDCIESCTECHATCLESINHCLGKGGKHAAPAHIALLATCADICAISADAMLRGAAIHTVTCSACAEICRQCAAACEGFGDDPEMQRCAETCRRCAQSCGAMASD